ncbi:DUF4249 domain-containing protein [Marivirga arenosa]|uniref:DUF4249 domain-containing protein n=1 Tax=Marivirga arenosa TaxID=3059076 RepID=A0AA49GFX7_9BACT|nr:DUF4249 domain-containing protein [Marivirga sp. ABR2-2]WKK85474.2 DUF4249 domain-containing protein [Marivirga sp. ABR2-2]
MKISHLFLSVLIFLVGCIDPLDVEVDVESPRLVVIAEISDLEEPYKVVLQRTADYKTLVNDRVTGATVSVVSSQGDEYFFEEQRAGQYFSCPAEFVGEVGEQYQLRIRTTQDKLYESSIETLLPSGEIDSAYYQKAERLVTSNTHEYNEKGIKVFCNFKDNSAKEYFMIDWQGTYKFQPSMLDTKNRYCWNTEASELEINLHDDQFSNNSLVKDYEITYLPDGLRFTEAYSFQVRLKSLTTGAYEFWSLIKQQYENDGSIFSALPAQISSNIVSLNNVEEKVLGYFTVSSVATYRIKIPHYALTGINEAQLPCKRFSPSDPVPEYCFDCTKFENSVGEEPPFW